MSRVGKLPVEIKEGVQAELKGKTLVVKGKLGELTLDIVDDVKVNIDDGKVLVEPANDSRKSKSMWGTTRSIINNMVEGVTEGYSIRLVINGVGYKAAVQNDMIILSLGFSHEIYYAIPKGVTIKPEKPTLLVISGHDKQLVGQIAGELIKLRPVEPYKGKGVYIEGTYIRRKEGKKK